MANESRTKRHRVLSTTLATLTLAAAQFAVPAWTSDAKASDDGENDLPRVEPMTEAAEPDDDNKADLAPDTATSPLGEVLGTPPPIPVGTYGPFDIQSAADDTSCEADAEITVVTVRGNCTVLMNPSHAAGTDEYSLVLDTQGHEATLTLDNVIIDFRHRDSNYNNRPPLEVRGGGEATVLLSGDNQLLTREHLGVSVAALGVTPDTALVLDSTVSGSVSGTLTAHSYRNAGIGGNNGRIGSSITIRGGTIDAASSGGTLSMGAGIGGGENADGTNINITGGNVTATGYYGAGIGGGYGASAADINITGGIVYAKSNMGAGIGGGISLGNGITGNGSDLTVAAAEVTAESTQGAGIGGGGFTGATGTNIVIKDGATISTKSVSGAGIGGGKSGLGSKIVIQDSTIKKADSSSGAAIGGGNGAAGIDITVDNSSIENATGGGAAIGGGIEGSGTEISITNSDVTAETSSSAAAIGGGGGNDRHAGGGHTIRISSSTITATVTGSGAGIGGGYNGDGSDIEITDGSDVHVTTENGAGIGGGRAGDGNRITIDGSTVNARATKGGSGIGGGYQGNAANVSITNSTVTAGSEDSSGAGIGGGNAGANAPTGGDGTFLSISGSTVISLGGAGAAIGGGQNGSGADITIANESVVVASSINGAGIGGGATTQDNVGTNIKIVDSEVTASSTTGAGIGGGYQGSASSISIHSGTVTATGIYGAGVGSGYKGATSSGNTIEGTFGSPTTLKATGYADKGAVEGMTVQVGDLAFQYATNDGAPFAVATGDSIDSHLSLGSPIGADEVGEYLQLVLPVIRVSWDSGEGSWTNEQAAAIACSSPTDNEAFPSPDTLEIPENKQFLGWSIDGGQTVADSGQSPCESIDTEVPRNLSFSAVFSQIPAKPITVSFNANGGSGVMEPQTAEGGTEFVIPDSKFSWEGFKFVGWKDGTGTDATSYSVGAAYFLDQDLVLYAQWESDPGDTDQDNAAPGKTDADSVDLNTPAPKGVSLPVTGGSLTVLWMAFLLVVIGGSLLTTRRS